MSNKTRKEKLYLQLKEFAVMTAYLWVVLGCFIAYKAIVLGQQLTDFTYQGVALINALALAKVMLIAKDLHVGERFDDRPLIYPTILKSALFAVILAFFKVLEEVAIGYFHHESFHESISQLAGGTGKGILTLTVLLFVVLIPLVGYMEIQRVLGEGKLYKLFFHERVVQTNQ